MKKKHILPAAFGAAVVAAALAAVLLIAADSAYRDIGVGLLSVAAAAFVADFLILMALKRRTVPAGIVKFWALLLMNCLLFVPAGVYWLGPVAIFHPNADAAAEQVLADTSRVSYVQSDDKTLCGWRYACGKSNAPVILCFYGNGETGSRKMVDFLDYLRQGYFGGFDIAVFDYPGYGRAPGRPTEAGVKEMALAAYDLVRQDHDTVCVFGYSIGTGAANYAAANRDAAALALMAPYADGYDLYNNLIPVFHNAFTRAMVSFKMESREFARKVKATPLILASPNDATVPFESSRALSECYADCVFRPVDVPDHGAFWQSAECMRMISDWFTEAVS